jgi:hypothetical protein
MFVLLALQILEIFYTDLSGVGIFKWVGEWILNIEEKLEPQALSPLTF